MRTPRISIITVSYKDPEGLRSTCQSLMSLKSAPFDWENVIVDSSPEQNKTVIEEYFSALNIVHVPDLPPRGIYSAQNQGFLKSQGEYVLFLNGGDGLVSAEVLFEALDILEKQPKVDFVAAGMKRQGPSERVHFPKKSFLKSILGKNSLYHPSMVYRRSSFEKVGTYQVNLKIAADYDHHVQAYIQGFHPSFLHKILSFHDGGGVSSQSVFKSLSESHQVQKKLRRHLSLNHKMLSYLLEAQQFLKMSVKSFF